MEDSATDVGAGFSRRLLNRSVTARSSFDSCGSGRTIKAGSVQSWPVVASSRLLTWCGGDIGFDGGCWIEGCMPSFC